MSATAPRVASAPRAAPRTAGPRRHLRLGSEVEAQLLKLRELDDPHALALLWQAIHEAPGALPR